MVWVAEAGFTNARRVGPRPRGRVEAVAVLLPEHLRTTRALRAVQLGTNWKGHELVNSVDPDLLCAPRSPAADNGEQRGGTETTVNDPKSNRSGVHGPTESRRCSAPPHPTAAHLHANVIRAEPAGHRVQRLAPLADVVDVGPYRGVEPRWALGDLLTLPKVYTGRSNESTVF